MSFRQYVLLILRYQKREKVLLGTTVCLRDRSRNPKAVTHKVVGKYITHRAVPRDLAYPEESQFKQEKSRSVHWLIERL